jgi:hypothetical protein
MTDSGSNSIYKQWDTPAALGQGLGIADRVFSLIKAASQDDVQPQALIALESLGSECLVSNDLIADGIDALKGNQSVRLMDSKLLLGLRNGNTIAELRKSTSCIQAFLLITALEMCGYDETSVADVLYHMLSCKSLLKTAPVSKQQLRTLLKGPSITYPI